MGKLYDLMATNFLEYASYVIKERAIPDVADGLKPVQRRILHSLWEMDDSKFNKVANVIGHCMKYHPHGDASIGDALVVLSNKNFFIDQQGNFGNIITGDPSSAARYIECRLTQLAKEVMFNKDITVYQASYDGRNKEPIALPSKIPTLLLLGAEGIAVGLSTKILPHNFNEVLRAQIAYLKNEQFSFFPDFQQGGLMDVSAYAKGNGKVKVRAVIDEISDKIIHITQIPYGTTTETLIASIENAAKKGKIKISSITDYTSAKVEIEIKLARGYHSDQTIDALYAFTDCEVSISPQMTLIKDSKPEIMDTDSVLEFATDRLVAHLNKELEIEREKLKELIHKKTLEQLFIENKVYNKIEDCETYNLVLLTVREEMEKFRHLLDRDIVDEDILTLLEIKIKRISKFDIDRSKKEIKELQKKLRAVLRHLKKIIEYTINYIEGLLEKYGDLYPRRTKITSFEMVDRREVTHEAIKIFYDREKGYFGHKVKSEESISCTPYDKLLVFFKDGTYKVINVPEKIYFEKELLYFDLSDKETVFNCVYSAGGRDGKWYVKRFIIKSFILDKDYSLFNSKDVLQYLSVETDKYITVYYKRKPRMKVFHQDVFFENYSVKGVDAKGNQISGKQVSWFKIKQMKGKKSAEAVDNEAPSEESTPDNHAKPEDTPEK